MISGRHGGLASIEYKRCCLGKGLSHRTQHVFKGRDGGEKECLYVDTCSVIRVHVHFKTMYTEKMNFGVKVTQTALFETSRSQRTGIRKAGSKENIKIC
jgi:hypothetical protein